MDNILRFEYKNWKQKISIRNIIPDIIYYGSTEYHPDEQWLLKGFDIDKNENRIFAIKDIIRFEE